MTPWTITSSPALALSLASTTLRASAGAAVRTMPAGSGGPAGSLAAECVSVLGADDFSQPEMASAAIPTDTIIKVLRNMLTSLGRIKRVTDRQAKTAPCRWKRTENSENHSHAQPRGEHGRVNREYERAHRK